jgi:NAD(P)-dependent dehydrogenase (short-subunit alcohol dehydrogenase family)
MKTNLFSLKGKIAIVTGSSKGIGKAIALSLSREGADLVVLSRHLKDAELVKKKIVNEGGKALALQIDISKKEEVDRLLNKTLSEYGRIDILVNNAGISPIPKRAENVSEAEWDQMMAINLKGLFFCCQAVGKEMIKQKHGKIINMSSVLGVTVRKGLLGYCVTKAAIIQLTKALAVEWAKYNIKVNALAPSWVDTEFIKALDETPKIKQSYIDSTPLGRFAIPEDIVGAVIYLASDVSDYVTGSTLFIDGGWTSI